MKCFEKVIELCPATPDGKELKDEAKKALQEVKIQILKDGNKYSRWQAGQACLHSSSLEVKFLGYFLNLCSEKNFSSNGNSRES